MVGENRQDKAIRYGFAGILGVSALAGTYVFGSGAVDYAKEAIETFSTNYLYDEALIGTIKPILCSIGAVSIPLVSIPCIEKVLKSGFGPSKNLENKFEK